MCNLYRMTASVDEMKELFGSFIGDRTNIPAHDGIYPNQTAPVFGIIDSQLTLQYMVWGILGWNDKQRPITNVRNLESNFWKPLLSKPESKILVPVSSFCEWTGEKGAKRKVWFGMEDQSSFAFAGIYRQTDEGYRFAFLTTEPNELVAPVHPKAMPVILQSKQYHDWLASDYDTAVQLAVPYDADCMAIF